jgi:hypothetical protein
MAKEQPMDPARLRATSIFRLLGLPVLITFGVTVLEMVWNSLTWSTRFAGDPEFALTAVVASFAGIYLALKLERAGQASARARLTLLLSVLGFLLLMPFNPRTILRGGISYANQTYVYQLAVVAVALLLISRPWTQLKMLALYSLVTRLPVCFFLLWMWPPAYAKAFGTQGTALGSNNWSALVKWVVLPQFITWTAFTIVLGSLTGAATLVAMRAKPVVEKAKIPRRVLSVEAVVLGVSSLGCAIVASLLSNPHVPRVACEAAQVGFLVTFAVALVAVVLGHISRRKLAIICGYLCLLLVYFYPGKSSVVYNACTGWHSEYQMKAIESLRNINMSEVTYDATYPNGFSQTLAQLDGAASLSTADAAGLIDHDLASGTKNGYVFTYTAGPPEASGKITSYTVTARPTQPGYNSLFTDQTGVIHVTREDRLATAEDPPLAG